MSGVINVQHQIMGADENYLESAARLRKMSRTKLLRTVIEIVLRDQLILSIMDDADRPMAVAVAKRDYTPRGTNPPPPPITRQRSNAGTISFRRSAPKTREELRRELEEAVRNTAGLPVE